MLDQTFTDNYGDPLEILSLEDDSISLRVTERSRSRGPAEVEFNAADAVGVAHAILDAAGAAKPASVQDDAVEFILHLSNGSRFFTGGFDDAATIWRILNDTRRTAEGIAGTFDADAPPEQRWNVTEFERGAVVAIEDLRLP